MGRLLGDAARDGCLTPERFATPHSETNESAGISLVKSTPEVSKDAMYLRETRPQNLLRWDLEVQPGANNEKAAVINYEFRIELDRQMAITSFTTK